jgi:hypothetical protein
VPCIRGEPVVVSFAEGTRVARSGSARLSDSTTGLRLTVKLPRPSSSAIGIGGGSGGSFGGRGGHRQLNAVRRPPTARISAVVVRRDGRPGAGALVRLTGPLRVRVERRADAQGRLTFERLRGGLYSLEVLEPGFLGGGPVEVRLGSGAEAAVRLREAAGRAVTVRLFDEEDRPVPCACISVALPSGVAYCAMEEGVQTLTLLTGSDGRIVLPNLPATGGRISAAYGSRTARAELTDESLLELTLGKTR